MFILMQLSKGFLSFVNKEDEDEESATRFMSFCVVLTKFI